MFTSLSFKFQSVYTVSSTKQSGIRGRLIGDVVFMNLMGFKGSREEPLPPLKSRYIQIISTNHILSDIKVNELPRA